MNDYLRDFINDNVGEECGGHKNIVNPITLQAKVNQCLDRLDKLEAGIGFTIQIKDQITLPFMDGDSEGKFISIVPANGTINRLAILSSVASEHEGLKSITIKVHKADGATTSYTYDINHKNEADTVVTNISVQSGEWLEMSAAPYSYEIAGTVSSNGSVSNGSTIISSAVLKMGMAILQLPAKTYGVGNAGSQSSI